MNSIVKVMPHFLSFYTHS